MTNWIKKLFQNQAIRYIFFGGCTTLVNLISYAIFRHFLGIDITIANFLSISLSILFAYVVNKIFVFESRTRGIRELLVEAGQFIGFDFLREEGKVFTDLGDTSLMDKEIDPDGSLPAVRLRWQRAL